jgi:hypothetical protein
MRERITDYRLIAFTPVPCAKKQIKNLIADTIKEGFQPYHAPQIISHGNGCSQIIQAWVKYGEEVDHDNISTVAEALTPQAGEPYRPSNGTEGAWFESRWCFDCYRRLRCSIWDAAACYDIDDPKYPKQLVYDGNGEPHCMGWRRKGALPKRMRQKGPGLFDQQPKRGA